jgi:FixJ family two-component response regulator
MRWFARFAAATFGALLAMAALAQSYPDRPVNKQYANLPFIMTTADPSIDKLVQAKNAGVTCFIKKPFRADELQAKILQANMSNRPGDVAEGL